MSPNGRYATWATAGHIWARDLQTGTTTDVPVGSATEPDYPDGWLMNVWPGGVSNTGRVVYTSDAVNLVPGENYGYYNVYVYDLTTSQVTRASVSSAGIAARSSSGPPSISADGRYVAFSSFASNLVPNDTNNNWDILVHDMVTRETSRVSVASDGTPADSRQGEEWEYRISLSADGRFVSFGSWSENLVPGDTNGNQDVFVHDRLTKTTTRVSVASNGAQAQGPQWSPGDYISEWSNQSSISDDGRYVTFASKAPNLVDGDTNGATDVFLHDRVSGLTRRISAAPDGVQLSGHSSWPSITGNGRYVAFAAAPGVVPGDTVGEHLPP